MTYAELYGALTEWFNARAVLEIIALGMGACLYMLVGVILTVRWVHGLPPDYSDSDGYDHWDFYVVLVLLALYLCLLVAGALLWPAGVALVWFVRLGKMIASGIARMT